MQQDLLQVVQSPLILIGKEFSLPHKGHILPSFQSKRLQSLEHTCPHNELSGFGSVNLAFLLVVQLHRFSIVLISTITTAKIPFNLSSTAGEKNAFSFTKSCTSSNRVFMVTTACGPSLFFCFSIVHHQIILCTMHMKGSLQRWLMDNLLRLHQAICLI